MATQNVTDPRLGPRGLDLMESGSSAEAALWQILDESPFTEYRQLVIVDRSGGTAHHSGPKALGTYAVAVGPGVVCAGNLLASHEVPKAMVAAFEAAQSDAFPSRLLLTMEAALAAGGEEGPIHSAGMLVADREAWPLVDLRVDRTNGEPIAELRALLEAWTPQMDDYVTRALDPAAAPSYGVPGDL